MTKQPVWKFVANLGDVNPVDHGGLFVFVDETGVYHPEAVYLEIPCDDEWKEIETGELDEHGQSVTREKGPWRTYRFCLESFTFVDGVLSDNEYHPQHPVWFADDLKSLGDALEIGFEGMVKMFCSDDAIERAKAYREVGYHWGFDNLSGSYSEIDYRDEVEKWCKEQGIEV
jgi:hypothetical protein